MLPSLLYDLFMGYLTTLFELQYLDLCRSKSEMRVVMRDV